MLVPGAVRRKMEVIKPIELLVGAKEKSKIKSSLEKSANYEVNEKLSGPYKLKLTEKETKAEIDIYFTPKKILPMSFTAPQQILSIWFIKLTKENHSINY